MRAACSIPPLPNLDVARRWQWHDVGWGNDLRADLAPLTNPALWWDLAYDVLAVVEQALVRRQMGRRGNFRDGPSFIRRPDREWPPHSVRQHTQPAGQPVLRFFRHVQRIDAVTGIHIGDFARDA